MKFSEFLETSGKELLDRLYGPDPCFPLPSDIFFKLESIGFELRSAAHFIHKKEHSNAKD